MREVGVPGMILGQGHKTNCHFLCPGIVLSVTDLMGPSEARVLLGENVSTITHETQGAASTVSWDSLSLRGCFRVPFTFSLQMPQVFRRRKLPRVPCTRPSLEARTSVILGAHAAF